mgnify:CR=1 FL=1
MGFFPTNTTESAARSGNQYTTNFNNPKFNSHGYSHVCHQAISGEVYVCPIRTKFRTSIAQQSTFKAPHSNPPLPPHSHLSLPQGVSWKETGNICFVLPSPRQGKNPEVYNYFGQDSIFIIEKEIEVEMKAELYSFLLENKFKNGVMYIKSMHEFVIKYDMAESVEEESLMRGFQRWRKKMKV